MTTGVLQHDVLAQRPRPLLPSGQCLVGGHHLGLPAQSEHAVLLLGGDRVPSSLSNTGAAAQPSRHEWLTVPRCARTRRPGVAASPGTVTQDRSPATALSSVVRREPGACPGADAEGRIRDPRDPRGLRAGPHHRRGDPADLRDLDLQAGRGRRAARRLRVQPLRQPHPDRARGRAGGRRGGGAGLRVRLRAGRRGHPGPCRVPAGRPRGVPRRRVRRHPPALRQGRAGVGGRAVDRGRCPTSTRCGPRSAPAARSWSGSRRPPTRCSTSATSRRSRRWPTRPGRCSSSTTPSPRRTSSSR